MSEFFIRIEETLLLELKKIKIITMFRLVGCCLNITHKQLLLFLYVMKYYNLENVAKIPMGKGHSKDMPGIEMKDGTYAWLTPSKRY